MKNGQLIDADDGARGDPLTQARVRLAPRRLSEAKRIKSWWNANRPAAPDLFDDELSAAIEQLAGTPTIETLYPAAVGVTVRRLLLPTTQNHVYYTVAGHEVVVLSVWGAPRPRGPQL